MPRKATKPKARKYKPMEICDIGEKIYQESLKKKLEPRLNGKDVVIDIITGCYLIGADEFESNKLAVARMGKNPKYGRKIGPDRFSTRVG